MSILKYGPHEMTKNTEIDHGSDTEIHRGSITEIDSGSDTEIDHGNIRLRLRSVLPAHLPAVETMYNSLALFS